MPGPFIFSKFMQAAGKFSPLKVIAFLFHLPSLIRLYSRLLGDKRVPFYLKLFCYAAIAYLLFPFDILPDLRPPVIGHLDDLAFLYIAFTKLVKDSPQEVVEEHVLAISEGN